MKGLLGSHDIQSLVVLKVEKTKRPFLLNETGLLGGMDIAQSNKKTIYKYISQVSTHKKKKKITEALEFQTFDHKALEAEEEARSAAVWPFIILYVCVCDGRSK
jgi:hypothetical protein